MVDLFRDRKTWLVGILLPFLLTPGPMLLIFKLESGSEEAARTHIPIAAQIRQVQMVDTLTRNPAVHIVDKSDPKQAQKDGEIRAIVNIDPHIDIKLQRNEPAGVEIFYNPANSKSTIAKDILQHDLQQLQEQVVASRLAHLICPRRL
ncbi:MAG: ABC transporter permease [Hydrogenibacillus schlegelii]|uniref:ABC transporter permease n=1 Tax=Hydrogenibacillus schlegelii TaxID=1484 RepID=A0A947CYS7_HYDSH|nr:ABC transporter permease [Hydrogenibacillus schlegelii]